MLNTNIPVCVCVCIIGLPMNVMEDGVDWLNILFNHLHDIYVVTTGNGSVSVSE